ncbi:hypothetical protein FRC17_010745 [Serendipita sp. 399]|nr:hypothetical protein FRC17_010745 [Serendipita sp. 399]
MSLSLLLVYMLARLRVGGVPRGPYILLAFTTFLTAIAFALNALPLVILVVTDYIVKVQMSAALIFDFGRASMPAVILWLLQLRGQAFGESLSGYASPPRARFRKRLMDCVLVVSTFIILVAFHMFNFTKTLEFIQGRRNYPAYQDAQNSLRMRHVISALMVFIALYVTASVTMIKVALKRAKTTDLVVNRLLAAVVPFTLAAAFTWFFFDIWFTVNHFNPWINLAFAILDGLSHVGVIAAIISTISLQPQKTASAESSSNLVGPPSSST